MATVHALNPGSRSISSLHQNCRDDHGKLVLGGCPQNGMGPRGHISGYVLQSWPVRQSHKDTKELHQNWVTMVTLIMALTCVGYLASAICWGSFSDISILWHKLLKLRASKEKLLLRKETDRHLNFSVSLIKCKRKCYQVGVLVWIHQPDRKHHFPTLKTCSVKFPQTEASVWKVHK